MVIQINPFHPQFWRTVNTMQIGLGEPSVRLAELSAAQERMIATLALGIADNQLEALTRQLKMPPGSGRELLARLTPVLMTEGMSAASDIDNLKGDLARATLDNNRDGFAVLRNRSGRKLWVNELAAPGVAIIGTLADAGFATFTTGDAAKVSEGDLGAYLTITNGAPRTQALSYRLRESGLAARVVLGDKTQAEFAVLVGQQAITPTAYTQLVNRGIPHLFVNFDTQGVSVTHLVIPGKTPCLFCLEQARLDADPEWSVIASQLLTAKSVFDSAATRSFAAAMVAQAATAWFDRGQATKKVVRLDAGSGLISASNPEFHASCECSAHRRFEQIQKSRALAS